MSTQGLIGTSLGGRSLGDTGLGDTGLNRGGLLGAAREARSAGWGEYLSAGLITLGILVALMI